AQATPAPDVIPESPSQPHPAAWLARQRCPPRQAVVAPGTYEESMMPSALTRRAIFLGAAAAAMLAWPLMAVAVEGKPAELKPEDIEFFEKHIRPLLVERCYECHSEEAEAREGGLWLDRRSALRR